MIVDCYSKKLHMVNINLNEMSKVFKDFKKKQKRVVTNIFSKKLQKTPKEIILKSLLDS